MWKHYYALFNTTALKQEQAKARVRAMYDDVTFLNIDENSRKAILHRLISDVPSKSTLILDSVTQLGKTADEIFCTYKNFLGKDIHLEFLDTAMINTDHVYAMYKQVEQKNTSVASYLQQELEEYCRFLESKKKGKAAAQAVTVNSGGKPVGRPTGDQAETKKAKAAKKIMLKECKAFGGSMKNNDLIQELDIAPRTFYAYLKALKRQYPEKVVRKSATQ